MKKGLPQRPRVIRSIQLGALTTLALVVWLLGASGGAKSLALPTVMRQDMQQIAAALGPTITVSWTRQSTSPMAPHAFAKAAGLEPTEGARALNEIEHIQLTWQSDGRYFETDVVTPAKRIPAGPKPGDVEYSFDGTGFYVHSADAGEAHSVLHTTFDDEPPRMTTRSSRLATCARSACARRFGGSTSSSTRRRSSSGCRTCSTRVARSPRSTTTRSTTRR